MLDRNSALKYILSSFFSWLVNVSGWNQESAEKIETSSVLRGYRRLSYRPHKEAAAFSPSRSYFFSSFSPLFEDGIFFFFTVEDMKFIHFRE